jgi:CheY-like chemotaxis protein
MMSDKTWRILVVDDEPDVLAISRLTMKNFEVYGVPVEIITAGSKVQAIELLHNVLSLKDSGLPVVAVAIIDVVMETDTAGLELCWYVREMMNNRLTQIYVRTGQPGVAPEREVVDRYDINGYFSKIDATEDKLYSIVKSGVRQFYFMQVAMSLSAALDKLILVSDSRDKLRQIPIQLEVDYDDPQMKVAQWMDGELLSTVGYGAEEAEEQRQLMEHIPGIAINNAGGDKYVMQGNTLYIKVTATKDNAEVWRMSTPSMLPPDFHTVLTYRYLKSAAALWKKAR